MANGKKVKRPRSAAEWIALRRKKRAALEAHRLKRKDKSRKDEEPQRQADRTVLTSRRRML